MVRGCLSYACNDNAPAAKSEGPAVVAGETPEEAARRLDEEKQREQVPSGGAGASAPCVGHGGGADDCAGSQGAPATPKEPEPSGGAGAGTSAPSQPCVGTGGGADDCLGSGTMPDLGVKTAPGNFDIYKK